MSEKSCHSFFCVLFKTQHDFSDNTVILLSWYSCFMQWKVPAKGIPGISKQVAEAFLWAVVPLRYLLNYSHLPRKTGLAELGLAPRQCFSPPGGQWVDWHYFGRYIFLGFKPNPLPRHVLFRKAPQVLLVSSWLRAIVLGQPG